uniref:Methylosome subunit pICln n=1 Tax=Naja naja TaxID=35670 RepID=A0A8C6XEM1_NAJNA
MSFLKRIPEPSEGIRLRQPGTEAVLAGRGLGTGSLYIAESRLSWIADSGLGFSLDYPIISLHAISRDLNSYPWEHLYVMVNAKFEVEESKESPISEEEEEERATMSLNPSQNSDLYPVRNQRWKPCSLPCVNARPCILTQRTKTLMAITMVRNMTSRLMKSAKATSRPSTRTKKACRI